MAEITEPNVSDTPVESAVTLEEAHAAGFLGHTYDNNPDSEYTFAGAAARLETGGGGAQSSSSSSSSGSSSSKSSSKDSASK